MFEPRVRAAAGSMPKVPGGDTGAEARKLKVPGMQRVPRNTFLHVYPKGGV